MTTFERFDFKNISYERAHEFARLNMDAFRDEAVSMAVNPKHEWLDDASLPPISEYEHLLKKARRFEWVVNGFARYIYLSLRSDWRSQIFFLRDASGKAVAGANWIFPKYHPAPAETPSFFYRLKTLLLKGWYLVLHVVERRPSPRDMPVLQFFNSVAEEYKCADNEERIKQLESMSVGELRDTTYPMGSSYYLNLFFVRTGQQGKNYGKLLMDHSLSFVRANAVPPPAFAVGAPPKASLQSVPKAVGFYKRYGYRVGGIAERTGQNGENLELRYYFMNLD